MRQLCHMAMIVIFMVALLSWAVPVANLTPTKPLNLHEAFTRKSDDDTHPPPIRKNGGVRGQSRLPPKQNKQTDEITNQDSNESEENSTKEKESGDESLLEEDNADLDSEEVDPESNALVKAASLEMKQDKEQLDASIGDNVFGRVQDDLTRNSTNDHKSVSTMNSSLADEVHIAAVIGKKIESEDSSGKPSRIEAAQETRQAEELTNDTVGLSLAMKKDKAGDKTLSLGQDSSNIQESGKQV